MRLPPYLFLGDWVMFRSMTVALAALVGGAAATSALAQAPPATPPAAPASRPAPPPRARGPALPLAAEAALAAIAACEAQGFKVAAQVDDSAGGTVAFLLGDGAQPRMQTFATSKLVSVIKYKIASSAAAERAKTEPELAAAIAADRAVGLPGAVPILVGGEFIGGIAVAGASSSLADEACAKTGVEKVQARLK